MSFEYCYAAIWSYMSYSNCKRVHYNGLIENWILFLYQIANTIIKYCLSPYQIYWIYLSLYIAKILHKRLIFFVHLNYKSDIYFCKMKLQIKQSWLLNNKTMTTIFWDNICYRLQIFSTKLFCFHIVNLSLNDVKNISNTIIVNVSFIVLLIFFFKDEVLIG